MTRLVIVTVLLAVVAVVVFWRGRSAGPQRTVKVTARAGLARGSAVAVVEVDGRRFLLGAAGNTVNVLAELDAAAAPEPEAAAHIAPVIMPAVAPVLEGYGVKLVDDHTLEVEMSKEQNLNDIFARLSAQQVEVLSMRNKVNRLEELFMRLVSQAPAPATATGSAA